MNYHSVGRRRPRIPGSGTGPIQQQVEAWMLGALSEKLGVTLSRQRFDLENGWFEVDGFSESPLIVCEVWAHMGMPKAGQKHKVMTDAYKLMFTRTIVGEDARCIMVFSDPKAAASFQGPTWMAASLKAYNIEVEVIEPPADLRNKMIRPPKRSFRPPADARSDR